MSSSSNVQSNEKSSDDEKKRTKNEGKIKTTSMAELRSDDEKQRITNEGKIKTASNSKLSIKKTIKKKKPGIAERARMVALRMNDPITITDKAGYKSDQELEMFKTDQSDDEDNLGDLDYP